MSAPANSALDDARKRARRRLLGAVVLALIAAVVVPLFLESDPKPLGPDVQIQIPPVDDAKFQNRLTPAGKGVESAPPAKGEAARGNPDAAKSGSPGASKDATSAAPGKPEGGGDARADAKTADRTPDVAADAKADGSVAGTKSEDAKAADARAGKAAEPRSGAKAGEPNAAAAKEAEPKAPAAKASDAKAGQPRIASAAPRPPEPPATTNLGTQTLNTAAPARKSGEFVVQIGAFVDKSVALDLAAKAGEKGFSVFLEPVTTKSGQVQRVRVGPFASRQAADEAAARLVKAGFTAVATAR